ncbi:hypothetical protein GOODEAATRI_029459 [Goodea atripinnis]|uniref:Uncharacterized protein n=1 Tax=Goodea atripinnis TaxID=208336 RepID=A0ABV0NEP7_9TELE
MGKCKFNKNWLSNQYFSALLKPVSRNVYEARDFVQEMFQTLHEGNQGSGVIHAKCRTQRIKIKFTTSSRYFPVLFHSHLYIASTAISDINSSTTSPCNVWRYAYKQRNFGL